LGLLRVGCREVKSADQSVDREVSGEVQHFPPTAVAVPSVST
jgi:hypothetical protein